MGLDSLPLVIACLMTSFKLPTEWFSRLCCLWSFESLERVFLSIDLELGDLLVLKGALSVERSPLEDFLSLNLISLNFPVPITGGGLNVFSWLIWYTLTLELEFWSFLELSACVSGKGYLSGVRSKGSGTGDCWLVKLGLKEDFWKDSGDGSW
jgi:hypothetical protein